jgi:hypothetical protein
MWPFTCHASNKNTAKEIELYSVHIWLEYVLFKVLAGAIGFARQLLLLCFKPTFSFHPYLLATKTYRIAKGWGARICRRRHSKKNKVNIGNNKVEPKYKARCMGCEHFVYFVYLAFSDSIVELDPRRLSLACEKYTYYDGVI